jgi:hypothetical protein
MATEAARRGRKTRVLHPAAIGQIDGRIEEMPGSELSVQQPAGGETPGVAGAPVALAGSTMSGVSDGAEMPGVAVAPVALAGAIMAGFARLILTLSLQADVFGVGITVIVGSMLVPASPATGG